MLSELEQELFQDFLLESREIVEKLDEQLVALEQDPKNGELLNSIFRGFHTIKGGAGFLDVGPMVTLCHQAEELFNQLRHDEKQVDAELMDASLAALDGIKSMFAALENGHPAPPASPEVIHTLQSLLKAAPATNVYPLPESSGKEPADAADTTFDTLLEEAANGETNADREAIGTLTPKDRIDESEFDAILDRMYGPGGTPGADVTPPQDVQNADQREVSHPPAEQSRPQEQPAIKSKPTVGSGWQGSHVEPTIRVDAHRLDALMNLVGELVLARNRLLNLAGSREDHDLVNAVSSLDHIASSLQDNIMRVRMQPIRRVFSRFPRVVRDLARQLGKDVDLVLEGEDTELDKNLIEKIADPLVHLLRNAVDHGLEDPQTRTRSGKSQTGRVRLAASQEGDHILLVIEDDGRGIDPDILKQSAIKRGLLTAETATGLSDSGAYDLMFVPGFSTCTEVSDISGRGVGMDVVRTRIAEMNGTVKIDSTLGKGSCFTIALPLTLAILPAMMVGISGNRYALPLSKVREIANFSTLSRHRIERQDSIVLRGQTLPLMDLRSHLGHTKEISEEGQVVVLLASNRELAMVVDEVLGQQDVVVKPMGPELSASVGITGSTITGDGSVALILDLDGIVRNLLREKAA
jgi:two-component system chemotaxis sensor kinase CheA